MSKLDENGKPTYQASGKVAKPPGYIKPDLYKILEKYL